MTGFGKLLMDLDGLGGQTVTHEGGQDFTTALQAAVARRTKETK